jgi:hypothetical protein
MSAQGSFHQDLIKTQDLIDIYLREQQHNHMEVDSDYLLVNDAD